MPETSTSPQTDQLQPESKPLTGLHRNIIWRVMQFLLQPFFVIWFRYRATGFENLPQQSGALLLINHQSYLDPLLVGIGLSRPVSYLARDSLFRIPILGALLRNTYVMAIKRNAAGTESLRLSINRIKEGYLVGIFPEGTRTIDGDLGELKPGFIAIVRRSKSPVIPVGIYGADRAMPKGSLLVLPKKIRVHYGKPLAPDKIKELTKRGREDEFVEYVTNQLKQAVQKAAQSNE